MLINLFCGLLILYLTVLFMDIILFSIRCFHRKEQSNCLTISKPIHCLCSIVTLIITGALLLNLLDFNMSIWWFYVLFGLAVIISIPLMLVVIFWKITWTDEVINYRNLFGYWKSYYIENIHLINRKQYTTIMFQDKKITDYNFMLLNILHVRAFETHLKVCSNYKNKS